MPRVLEGKVAVITGASTGIGRAVSERYLDAGARLVVFARDREGLEVIRASAPDAVLAVAGDVTKSADLQRLVEDTALHYGSVDIVVPNAGMAKVVSFADSTEEAIQEQFSVNFVGAVQTARLFLPHINRGGSILFNTSFLTQVGFPGLAIYSASKAALKSVTQTLAAELAPQGIRVNAIAPGPIATPLWGKVGLQPDTLQAVAEQINARLMPGQFGKPEDIAEMAVFLASDAARNIYGQEIVIDGGYTVG
ncbi:SDR family oxidoreductase [Skermanella mucosa]|uniref:SDR family NAD(P)-dependent oxidoreductase n=1 Tax=Skermanella mucosa TaxID=1789672 RepID=UPI00192B27F1|nr:SDR family oxidoreductase [Skermanella mucosa]UEM20840.1 SDR family oxidoreductase [Skermanella mucosa]